MPENSLWRMGTSKTAIPSNILNCPLNRTTIPRRAREPEVLRRSELCGRHVDLVFRLNPTPLTGIPSRKSLDVDPSGPFCRAMRAGPPPVLASQIKTPADLERDWAGVQWCRSSRWRQDRPTVSSLAPSLSPVVVFCHKNKRKGPGKCFRCQ
jgi:hypothetical protein